MMMMMMQSPAIGSI